MIFIALWMVALMFYTCAAVAPPDGGPKDETPPQFISAMPEAGSLHFKGGKVSIKFSEYIPHFFSFLLPLDRGRGFAADVVHDAVNSPDLIGDPRGNHC